MWHGACCPWHRATYAQQPVASNTDAPACSSDMTSVIERHRQRRQYSTLKLAPAMKFRWYIVQAALGAKATDKDGGWYAQFKLLLRNLFTQSHPGFHPKVPWKVLVVPWQQRFAHALAICCWSETASPSRILIKAACMESHLL